MENNLSREEQKEMKRQWSNQYKELEKIVNEWDPINLISGGAPVDEYDCLSTQLLSLLHRGKSLGEIKSFVFAELAEHFDYKIEYIEEEYRGKFVKQANGYCEKIVDWFETYKKVSKK